MKLLICSDSHGRNDILKRISSLYKDIDLYLHAGDGESSENELCPFISVRGNCDYFSNLPEGRIIPTPLGNLYISHFPYIDQQYFKKNNIKIFVHGHTHCRKFEKKQNLYIINPGSISYARDKNNFSYCILEITDNDLKNNFYTI